MKLSLSAKGLFLYVAAKPAGWKFCAARIGAEIGCGERAVKTARKELESAGLLIKRRERKANGDFGSFTYELPILQNSEVQNAPVQNAPMQNAPVQNVTDYPKKEISGNSNNPNTYIKPAAAKKRKEAKPQRTFSEIRRLIAEKDAETNAEKEKENERAKLRNDWAMLISEKPEIEKAVKSFAAEKVAKERPELSPAFRRPLIVAVENKLRRRIIDGEKIERVLTL